MTAMSDQAVRAEIVVDLAAVRHNVRVLRDHVGVDVMVVVKADAYGHGLVPVARAARRAGATWLGAATLDEAVALREAGDTGRVLTWLAVPGEDRAPAVAHGIDVTAYTVEDLDHVADAVRRARTPARLQLKIDTGLSRGGSTADAWPDLVRAARAGQERGDWTVTGVWSHLACSDEPDHPANAAQQAAFATALAQAREAGLDPEVVHLANSAGAILLPGARHGLVRIGLAAYGLDPAPGHTPDLGLRPAMTVRASLAQVKRVGAGAGVSYGHTWVADRPTTLGLVPAGYGDGVPRHAGNRAQVDVAGKRSPLRGRVCMDQVVVEVDDDARAGDEVVLFGAAPHPTAQDWAEACETISYEIVTRIGGRFARRHVHEEDG
jgi:alanine racemase